jgi:hypothetical protein
LIDKIKRRCGQKFFRKTPGKEISFKVELGEVWRRRKAAYRSREVVEICPKLLKKEPIVANVRCEAPMELILRQ